MTATPTTALQDARDDSMDAVRAWLHGFLARRVESPEIADDPQATQRELAGCLRSLVERLAEPYRSAVNAVDLNGHTQTEVARTMGLSVSGMKSRVQRGRRQLRQLLTKCCRVHTGPTGGISGYEPGPNCTDETQRGRAVRGATADAEADSSRPGLTDNRASIGELVRLHVRTHRRGGRCGLGFSPTTTLEGADAAVPGPPPERRGLMRYRPLGPR